ncbi:MAG TPA: hypothetical protein VL549_09600 [Gemmatimonadales bacterium]|jgi:hypothetical protein|nr:hypothetical protein [Gemmatimonadales bacterium]
MRSGFLAAVLALVSAACAHPGGTAQLDPNAATTVKVTNDNVLDMNVYVLSSSGSRFRLGMVSGGHTEVFTVPAALIHGPTDLRFQTRSIGSQAGPRTETITVSPGDQVVLLIPPE